MLQFVLPGSPEFRFWFNPETEDRHIFILLIFLIIALPSYGHDVPPKLAHRATIIRIIDGDTFEADIHIFINQILRNRIRIADIDTAEIKRSQCEAERQAGKQAKARLAKILPIDSMVTLSNARLDNFGRVVSHVHHDTLGNIGTLLLTENHARPYDASSKNFWCR